MKLIQPDGWLQPRGYANGLVAEGRLLVTAGQIGWDPATSKVVSDDFVEQARQALANVVAVLGAGGARPEHTVRLTWYVTDAAEYRDSTRALGAAYRAAFGTHYPAMAVVVVAALIEPGAKVEIEATAVIPKPTPDSPSPIASTRSPS